VTQNLGTPLGVEEAVDTAVHGVPLGIDLGRHADGRFFALMAGAGLDAEGMRGGRLQPTQI
jgi:diacylglycerol kinase family enzyme